MFAPRKNGLQGGGETASFNMMPVREASWQSVAIEQQHETMIEKDRQCSLQEDDWVAMWYEAQHLEMWRGQKSVNGGDQRSSCGIKGWAEAFETTSRVVRGLSHGEM